ncbi:Imm10 family immunity protein [Streptomyces flaveolus]|uniref:Imm10 family immunity protein n=1 Tax=Streptomyces flaveolus TaxID=67297 RepID=UPI0033A25BD6
MSALAKNSQWIVRVVVVTEDDDCFTVGMAEDGDGEGCHLSIQSGVREPDAQQLRLGWDTYCVMNETGAVHYGGIESAAVAAGKVSFRFSSEAAAELSLPGESLELALHEDVDVATLRVGLHRVLTYGNTEKVPAVLDV